MQWGSAKQEQTHHDLRTIVMMGQPGEAVNVVGDELLPPAVTVLAQNLAPISRGDSKSTVLNGTFIPKYEYTTSTPNCTKFMCTHHVFTCY